MITNIFKTIHLDEMGKVQLMNRIDRKFWFHQNKLQGILNAIGNDYLMLHINEKDHLPYQTIYYEAPDDDMYLSHHNGKLNRIKIRKRTYVDSRISFLEIKFKNNKGRTIKKRILSEFGQIDFTTKEKEFITALTTYDANSLEPLLVNEFTRLTLVSKTFKERCTIDINLHYHYKGREVGLNDLVIVELKSDGNMGLSPLAKVLRDNRIKTSGFSKYCFGRSITDAELKRNAFKDRIRRVEKIIQPEINLLNIN